MSVEGFLNLFNSGNVGPRVYVDANKVIHIRRFTSNIRHNPHNNPLIDMDTQMKTLPGGGGCKYFGSTLETRHITGDGESDVVAMVKLAVGQAFVVMNLIGPDGQLRQVSTNFFDIDPNDLESEVPYILLDGWRPLERDVFAWMRSTEQKKVGQDIVDSEKLCVLKITGKVRTGTVTEFVEG